MSLNDDLDSKVVALDAKREQANKPTKVAKMLAALDFADITATGVIKPTCCKYPNRYR